MLEDGSVVYLSEQTTLAYPDRFDEHKREVVLHGEAFFEIKKQAGRPFIVNTDVANVEVTGTSFKIKSNDNTSFLLSVREGEVRVRQKGSRQTLTVAAGETVSFDSEQLQLQKSAEVFDDCFERIHFKDEYLTDVAAIINLHSDSLQLTVDPSIEKRITFTYPVNSKLAETVEAICRALNLRHSQQDHIIHISKAE
jgi:ferric-dicitrate binding protein FerR (iron transport regulator)